MKKGKFPPIWIGAHGPKMLNLTGRLGDGWMPIRTNNMDPMDYSAKLQIVNKSAKANGRDPEKITPSLWCSLIIDEDHEECHKLHDNIFAKTYCLTFPSKVFESYGVSHPLGDNFNGLLEFIPTKYEPKEILEAFDKIPLKMCQDSTIHGTPDEVIKQIEEYMNVGLTHIILWNATFIMDPAKLNSSMNCIKKVIDYFKDKNKS